jgi:hypothetical protein
LNTKELLDPLILKELTVAALEAAAGIAFRRPLKIKGGGNQVGYHLPGWGGVLLGKLNLAKPPKSASLKITGSKNSHLSSPLEIA